MYSDEDSFEEYPVYDTEEKKNQKNRKGGMIALVALCLLIITAGAVLVVQTTNHFLKKIRENKEVVTQAVERGGSEDSSEEELFTNSVREETAKIPSTAILAEVPQDTQVVVQIADNVLPSIVSITSTITQVYNWFGRQYSQEAQGAGSGIIIDQTDESLLILTNYHVVEGGKDITVMYNDGETTLATIKGYDSDADLAVLSVALSDLGVQTMDTIRVAKMGDSDSIRIGEMVIAIGNALGYGQTVTVGYVSAKDRIVESEEGTSLALIQTDAAINPGNSGGALLNLKGEVIGINSIKYVDENVEGMGFAIPVTTAEPIIEELKNREIISEEEKGYIGIVGEDISEEIARAYRMPSGIYVYSVSEDGPSEKAGLVTGDIIFKINDTTVKTMSELKEKVGSYRAGSEVDVSYYRNVGGRYEEFTVKVTLAKAADLKFDSDPQH